MILCLNTLNLALSPCLLFRKKKRSQDDEMRWFLVAITLPPTYGEFINHDGNYLLTLQVSVRLSWIKANLERSQSQTAVSYAGIYLRGYYYKQICSTLLRRWKNPYGLVHVVKQSHSNLGAQQTASLRLDESWGYFKENEVQLKFT